MFSAVYMDPALSMVIKNIISSPFSVCSTFYAVNCIIKLIASFYFSSREYWISSTITNSLGEEGNTC